MTLFSSLALDGVAAVTALGRELRAWKGTRTRALFNVQAVLSVALAVLLARMLHLEHTWWAAISGFAILRDSVRGCIERGAHRMLGTLAGAAFGVLAGPWIADRPWLVVPVLGAVAGCTVLRANASASSYAWVLGGVTATMVIAEARVLGSARTTLDFALSRVAEVAVGTLACVLVATVVTRIVARHPRVSVRVPSATCRTDIGAWGHNDVVVRTSTGAARVRLGICAALATAVMAAFGYVVHLPGSAQAMVTSIALLILPADALVDRTPAAVRERMMQRLIGCVLAGALGVMLLPLINGAALPCMLALSFGVWAGCHVQNGAEGASYVGRQFAVAFVMVFVQDHHWSADPHPALMRFCGILTGVIVLSLVMLAIRVVWPVHGDHARAGSGDLDASALR
ncbi:TPA: FUSC family protein [Burkholderia cenocepacia]|uniref:FUSC family protein n=1 Tax=unclassified Burkholderia TaxID=2613784 RepID=UPI00158A395E|nr:MULTISPECIES: FUSC family protein [unclassified Burkholderia]HEF5875076.1 FUSC family protein [Burkholderia cenocepacia]